MKFVSKFGIDRVQNLVRPSNVNDAFPALRRRGYQRGGAERFDHVVEISLQRAIVGLPRRSNLQSVPNYRLAWDAPELCIN
jgi:hypothetical protein